MRAIFPMLALLLLPSIAHADEAKPVPPEMAPPPSESSSRFFLHASVGIGRAGLFTGFLTQSSTRVPIIVGVGIRKEKLFITAAELVADPGETDHGVSVPRFALGPRIGYMPVSRLNLSAGIHAGVHMLFRKSDDSPGPFAPVDNPLWRLSAGLSGTIRFDVIEIVSRHWLSIYARGDLDWVFKTSFRTASIGLGYAFQ